MSYGKMLFFTTYSLLLQELAKYSPLAELRGRKIEKKNKVEPEHQ
jgi:hypothetical protein